MQDTNFADLIPNISNIRHYKVKINQVDSNDSMLLGSQGSTNTLNFYTIDLHESFIGNFQREGSKYFSLFISLDQQINLEFIIINLNNFGIIHVNIYNKI